MREKNEFRCQDTTLKEQTEKKHTISVFASVNLTITYD